MFEDGISSISRSEGIFARSQVTSLIEEDPELDFIARSLALKRKLKMSLSKIYKSGEKLPPIDSKDLFQISSFFLSFKDKQTRERFFRFLSVQHSVIGTFLSIILPVLITVINFAIGYLLTFRYSLPSYSLSVGILSLFFGFSFSIYYLYLIYMQGRYSKTVLALDAKTIASADSKDDYSLVIAREINQVDSGDDENSSHRRALQSENIRTRKIMNTAAIVAFLSIFVYAWNAYTRTVHVSCRGFCIANIPALPFIALNYLPLHLAMSLPLKWSSLLTCEISARLASYFILLVNNKPSLVSHNIQPTVSVFLFWIVWVGILWYVYKKSMIIFMQREILTQYAVLEERKYLDNNALWFL